MILTIDIGNSSIVIGCMKKKEVVFLERISTNLKKTELEYAIELKNAVFLHEIDTAQITGGILSSVVPPLNNTLISAVSRIFHFDIIVVGPGLKTGLNIKIDNPAQLGSNLVVDSVAALSLLHPPIIIIDMGTATSICALNESGTYIGGAILPGLQVSIDALSSKTAQLPQISLESPKRVIGKNTIECMESGTIYGTAAMLDGMLSRFEAELDATPSIIATGQLAKFVIPHCEHIIQLDESLMLKGLAAIYEKNK